MAFIGFVALTTFRIIKARLHLPVPVSSPGQSSSDTEITRDNHGVLMESRDRETNLWSSVSSQISKKY